jgi:hypothetical protein
MHKIILNDNNYKRTKIKVYSYSHNLRDYNVNEKGKKYEKKITPVIIRRKHNK